MSPRREVVWKRLDEESLVCESSGLMKSVPGTTMVWILTAQRLICWGITSIMWWLLFETVLFLSESVLKSSCSPSSCLILCTGSSLVVATQRRYTEDGLALVGLLSDSFQLSPPQGCVGSQPPSLPLSLLPQIWNLCSGLRHYPWLFPEAAAPSPNKGELAGILELKQTAPRNSWGERDSRLSAQPEVFSVVGNLLLKGRVCGQRGLSAWEHKLLL